MSVVQNQSAVRHTCLFSGVSEDQTPQTLERPWRFSLLVTTFPHRVETGKMKTIQSWCQKAQICLEIKPFAATWMNPKVIRLSEKCQRKTNIWYCSYVESKKNNTHELIYKNRNRFTENKHGWKWKIYGYQWGKVGVGDKLGVWDWHVHITILKINNQQAPTA